LRLEPLFQGCDQDAGARIACTDGVDYPPFALGVRIHAITDNSNGVGADTSNSPDSIRNHHVLEIEIGEGLLRGINGIVTESQDVAKIVG
jgi:hypothetical protein